MSWRIFVFVLLVPALVSAQTTPRWLLQGLTPQLTLEYEAPPLLALPAGEDNIVPLSAGELAPFQGQLLDAPTALRWAHYLQQAKLRLTEDVLAERRTCSAHLDFARRRFELELELSSGVEADLRARVVTEEQRVQDLQTRMNNPGFFDSRGTWFGLGMISSAVVVGLGILFARTD